MTKPRDRVSTFLRIPASQIIPNAKNWRTHPPEQQEALRAVLSEIGIAGALLVRRKGKKFELLDGHLRHESEPDTKWPCLVLDLTDEEADKLLVTYDPIGDLAGKNLDALRGLVDLVNFDSDVLRQLAENLAPPPLPIGAPAVEQDEVPDLPKRPRTRPGDLYTLGRHRLLCGDATVPDDVHRLMGRNQADLLITDPPYNVAYQGGTDQALTIANDSMDEAQYQEFLTRSFRLALEAMRPGAVWYIWHADIHGLTVRQAAHQAGYQVRQCLVWIKNSLVLCRQDYQWRHEPCLCGQKNPDGDPADKHHDPCLTGWKDGAAHEWQNDRCQTTVLEYARPTKSEQHPTMKPLPMIAYLVGNSSREGQLVIDPFGGSGTTLLAAEKLSRRCYTLELDPAYCDVIVDRWQEATGQKATRDTTVKPTKKKKK